MDATRDTVVDLWFNPVCPYSWTASRWLHEVSQRRQLTCHYHVMSLDLLNQVRTDIAPDYRRNVEASRGPAKVATEVVTRCGLEALADFYGAFGERVFDVWRRHTAAEYREVVGTALAEVGLPAELVEPVSPRSTTTPCGSVMTPGSASSEEARWGRRFTSIDGVAFFGPVLNGMPRGEPAAEVFEGARLLAGYPQFFELKRTRVEPPAFT